MFNRTARSPESAGAWLTAVCSSQVHSQPSKLKTLSLSKLPFTHWADALKPELPMRTARNGFLYVALTSWDPQRP